MNSVKPELEWLPNLSWMTISAERLERLENDAQGVRGPEQAGS